MYTAKIAFGKENIGAKKYTEFSFDTQFELDAFLLGVEHTEGWLDVAYKDEDETFVPPDYIVSVETATVEYKIKSIIGDDVDYEDSHEIIEGHDARIFCNKCNDYISDDINIPSIKQHIEALHTK